MKALSCLSLLLGAAGVVLGIMGDPRTLLPGAILWAGALIALSMPFPEPKKTT
jgi:hypothetical protein